MTVEIISWSISTKVLNRAGIATCDPWISSQTSMKQLFQQINNKEMIPMQNQALFALKMKQCQLLDSWVGWTHTPLAELYMNVV